MLLQTEPATVPGPPHQPVRGQTRPRKGGSYSQTVTTYKRSGTEKNPRHGELPGKIHLKPLNNSTQQSAFENIKESLTTAPVLTYYDVTRPTAVSADASSCGLGGVLLQLQDGAWRPVAYCSRRLTEAETRYAQIEKECLAGVWACEKFDKYLCGLDKFKLETDHKPLVPLVNNRSLDNVPLRCQRLLMRLMRYKTVAEYVPGKTLVIADALSRSPQVYTKEVTDTHCDVACHVAAVMEGIPASPTKMDFLRKATSTDCELQTVITYIRSGWPEYAGNIAVQAKEYSKVRNELSEYDGLVVRGSRIVVPGSMRTDILQKLHDGHQGLTKCRERANAAVWWPGLATELKNTVMSCRTCQEQRRAQTKKPLISTPLPDRPWKRIALDLCEHNKHNYLVISDYYSRFLEVLHLPSTTSAQVVQRLKATFARFGIPEEVVSDNGPQFSSAEFQELAKQLDFKHVTSSPHHPQGNGHAERAVQTAKRILQQDDPLMALMSYRSTPCTTTGVSPAELLMGRKIRTTVPTLEKNLRPKWPNRTNVKARDLMGKAEQAFYYNRRHGARPLPALCPGDTVLTKLDHEKAWTTPAVILSESSTPRSYVISTQRGAMLRRNRCHLQAGQIPQPAGSDPPAPTESTRESSQSAGSLNPETVCPSQSMAAAPSPRPGQILTRSGRVSKPADKLDL